MQELYIIRHGLAGVNLDDEAMDEARSLTKKGKDKMKAIAKSLKDLKINFDLVLTSPLLRSTESAEIINAYCSEKKEVTITDNLSPEASYTNLIKFLNKLKEYKRIAIVGHEPFLSGFASYCLTKNKTPLINLKKGGVLLLEIDEVIKPGSCLLSWLIEPRHLIHEKSNN